MNETAALEEDINGNVHVETDTTPDKKKKLMSMSSNRESPQPPPPPSLSTSSCCEKQTPTPTQPLPSQQSQSQQQQQQQQQQPLTSPSEPPPLRVSTKVTTTATGVSSPAARKRKARRFTSSVPAPATSEAIAIAAMTVNEKENENTLGPAPAPAPTPASTPASSRSPRAVVGGATRLFHSITSGVKKTGRLVGITRSRRPTRSTRSTRSTRTRSRRNANNNNNIGRNSEYGSTRTRNSTSTCTRSSRRSRRSTTRYRDSGGRDSENWNKNRNGNSNGNSNRSTRRSRRERRRMRKNRDQNSGSSQGDDLDLDDLKVQKLDISDDDDEEQVVSAEELDIDDDDDDDDDDDIHDEIDHDHEMDRDHDVQVQARVLDNMEYTLRHVLILIGTYLLGAYHNELGEVGFGFSDDNVWGVARILSIAWGTCVAIKVMSWYIMMDGNGNGTMNMNMNMNTNMNMADVLESHPLLNMNMGDNFNSNVDLSMVEMESDDGHRHGHGNGHGNDDGKERSHGIGIGIGVGLDVPDYERGPEEVFIDADNNAEVTLGSSAHLVDLLDAYDDDDDDVEADERSPSRSSPQQPVRRRQRRKRNHKLFGRRKGRGSKNELLVDPNNDANDADDNDNETNDDDLIDLHVIDVDNNTNNNNNNNNNSNAEVSSSAPAPLLLPLPLDGRRDMNVKIQKTNNNKIDEQEQGLTQTQTHTPEGNRGFEQEHGQEYGSVTKPQEHPELEQLYVFNHLTGKRVRPNSPPEIFENEFVICKFLLMIRTSDADVKTEGMGNVTRGTAANDAISNYFRPKQRRFEIQMQMKFKKKPNKLWFSASVEDPVKLGPMQKLFVRAAFNFAEKKNRGQVHANPTGTMMETEEGGEDDAAAAGNNYAGNPNFEAPHYGISFDKAFDVIVETKEGDEYESNLPKLGAEVSEDPEAMKKRKKDGMVFNTTSTYTVCCWSAYADFLKWKIVNLPAIRPFSIDGVLGDPPLNISIYSLKEDTIENEKADHRNGNLLRICDMEVGNAKKCRTSRLHKKWKASLQHQKMTSIGTHKKRSLHVSVPDVEDELLDVSEGEEEKDEVCNFSDSGGEDDDRDEDDDSRLDEETVALEDLGEGLYLKSLDPIVLRQWHGDDPDVTLTNGGGFATLQVNASATVSIEKVEMSSKHQRKSRKNGSQPSSLESSKILRNGDTVRIQLVDPDDNVRYLSVSGWWLKWVHRTPKSSSLFTIHTNDIESSESNLLDSTPSIRSLETQSSFLRLGGTFELETKNSAYRVGIVAKTSATYGGRVLGLYKRERANLTSPREGSESGRITNQMLIPLRLYADVPITADESRLDNKSNVSPKRANAVGRSSSLDGINYPYQIDAPAWIEMMHRTKRQIQRVYAIRMVKEEDFDEEIPQAVIRLRTGKDLAHLLRLGVSADIKGSEPELIRNGEPGLGDGSDHSSDHVMDYLPHSPPKVTVFDSNHDSESSSDVEYEPDEEVSDDLSESFANKDIHSEDTTQRFSVVEARKKKKWIKQGVYKVAKGVKTGTIKSGQIVTKSGKIVTKSGKMVGKAVSHPFKHRGVLPEQKFEKRKSKLNTKDHHLAVNKVLDDYSKHSSPSKKRRSKPSLEIPNSIMAGQLKAPEQSRRTVGYLLSQLLVSANAAEAKELLSQELNPMSDLDSSFLSGGLVELGVVPDSSDKGIPIGEYVVARALWAESHWREEGAIIFDTCIDFYAPLSFKPTVSIPFYDIEAIRRVDTNHNSYPHPGLPLVAIETAWKCHYVAFYVSEVREQFISLLQKSMYSGDLERFQKEEMAAHLWQGFGSFTEEDTKWGKVTSGKRSKQRYVLNSRRKTFDCCGFDEENIIESIGTYTEDLLEKALSFSMETLEKNPKDFSTFLDETCRLRLIPFESLDRKSKSTFCIYINIYHTLLQHSLLLSKIPPNKKNVGHFMRTHCYEIGSDVFSLAELECCVIRGNSSQAYHPRPPFVGAPKNSRAHFCYALESFDPKINFVLNTGNMANAASVPILKVDGLEEQLHALSRSYMFRRLSVDTIKRSVTLPKVCDIFRQDFGEINVCLHYCLQFLSDDVQSMIIGMMENGQGPITIKYDQACDRFYTSLKALK